MKRLRVLAGRTNYGSAQSFYHHGSPYTGHVREWTAGELHQLAGWLGLDDVAVVGRNWLGHQRFPRIPEALRSILDRGLQARPGPCSDLYLVASTQFGGHGASRLPNDHGGE